MSELPRGAEPRLTRMEGEVKGLSADFERLSQDVREGVRNTRIEFDSFRSDLASKLDGLQKEFTTSRQPQWNLYLGGAMFMLALVTAIGGMAFLPLYLNVANANEKGSQALQWQSDYQRNLIPSSAKGDIDALRAELHSELAKMTGYADLSKYETEKQISEREKAITRLEQTIAALDDRQRVLSAADARIREKLGIP